MYGMLYDVHINIPSHLTYNYNFYIPTFIKKLIFLITYPYTLNKHFMNG